MEYSIELSSRQHRRRAVLTSGVFMILGLCLGSVFGVHAAVAAGSAEAYHYEQFGSGGLDGGRTVAVDADGNRYVAGIVSGNLSTQTTYLGQTDAFVRKYDRSGNELWSRIIGSAVQDSGFDLVLTSSAVYLVGSTDGAVFDQSNLGGRDGFIAKYLLNGDLAWTRQFGTTANDEGRGITFDGTNLYVAGWTQGALNGQAAVGNTDAFVISYDANGTYRWTQQFGSTDADQVHAVYAGSDGVYVLGTVGGSLPGQVSAGGGDAFIKKFDDRGRELWVTQFGGPAYDLATDAYEVGGALYVVGDVSASLDGQPYSSDLDAFVRRYTPAGQLVWTRMFGGALLDEAATVVGDSSGVYVSGFVESSLPGYPVSGATDVYVRKYSVNGDTLWHAHLGTSGSEDILGSALDGDDIVVTGSVSGAWPNEGYFGNDDVYYLVLRQDTDGDGIYDAVDTAPTSYSNSFSDGTSNGTIVTRGDQQLHIVDADDVAAGVTITALPGGGVTPAAVNQCGISLIFLTAGDSVTVTCGSVTMAVTQGPIEAELYTDDGRLAETTVSAGNIVKFEADTATLTAAPGNTEVVAVTVGNVTTTVAPGTTADVPVDLPITVDTLLLSSNVAALYQPVTVTATLTVPSDETATMTGISVSFDGGTYQTATALDGAYDEETESASMSLSSFATPGVHEVCVRGADTVGSASDIACALLAVYDPTAGYVTGGGQVQSPVGAYVLDPSLVGTAHFAFVSEYEEGTTVPSGNTHFKFQAADLKFKSTAYDWLVVANHKAQFKGYGTINNSGNYGFLLSAVDGNLLGNSQPDKFRMKIWNATSGVVVYDNQLGASDASEASTAISQGSVVIHHY